MIICGDCGNENQDGDAFCGVCGSFLEWEGRKVGAEPEPAMTAVEDAAAVQQKGPIERVVDRLSGAGQPARDADRAHTEPREPLVDGSAAVTELEEDEADPATTLAMEAAEQAHLRAEAAERARSEAEERALREAEAAELARREAERAEQERLSAQEAVAQEAVEAERLRAALEQAEASRAQAQAELERERAALERLRPESEEARQQAEERLAAEHEAFQQARAEAEAAEAARQAAEERARTEADAAAAAARQAAEAEEARRAAEAKAREEAEAAKRARQAAALVAKPKPRSPEPPASQVGGAVRPVKTSQPVQEPKTGTDPIKPVKPVRAKVRPTSPKRPQPPSRKLRPGDLICGDCGEGNDEARNFCRRCGGSLKEAQVARAPWWRRLPRRRTYAAGERRGRRGRQGGGALDKGRAARRKFARVSGLVGRAGALLALLGVVGMGVGPWRGTVMGWLGDRFTSVRQVVAPQFEPIRPEGAVASSERADHPAAHAIDSLSTTWWAAAQPDGGLGATLLVTFPGPVAVDAVGFTSGAADVTQFAEHARPAKVHLLFDNGFDVELELTDRHEFQPFTIDRGEASGVTNVLIRVTEVYPGQAGGDLSVTEIEFRTRR